MTNSKDTYVSFTIELDTANQRFDRYLRKLYRPYTTVTLPTIYSRIRKGYIRLNDKKAKEDTKVLLDDVISINTSQTIPLDTKFQSNKPKRDHENAKNMITNHIIYEDEHRLVFNKPPHILMHPGSGSSKTAVTMNDRLYTYLNLDRREQNENLLTKGSTFKPAFCYRLDKDTSGVLIAAKTYDALQYLNERIRDKEVQKWYVVATYGLLPNQMTIDKPLFKGFHAEKGRAHMFINHEKGVEAVTHVYRLASSQDAKGNTMSLGLVKLTTGRMHQIRVHLASEHFPVIGDQDYGVSAAQARLPGVHRQLLHSAVYEFYDSYTKKNKQFFAPAPQELLNLFPTASQDKIEDAIKQLLQKSNRHHE